MDKGRMADVRYSKSSGKYRLRFYSVAEDHLQTIRQSLTRARAELGTNHDSVALEAICMSYLCSEKSENGEEKK